MDPPPRPTPALPDELVEEVLVRSPPDDPSRLVRAALVCKHWCRLVSAARFRRRFCEFHRTPPMLGFLYDFRSISKFVRTAPTCPPLVVVDDGGGGGEWFVVDARHGHVLVLRGHWGWNENPYDKTLSVCDPITGERKELPLLKKDMLPSSWNAAVLCAASSSANCDHSGCRGAFMVVVVGVNSVEMFAHVYSSEAGAWGEKIVLERPESDVNIVPSTALVWNALYFMLLHNRGILKYNLSTHEMSVIDVPMGCSHSRKVLMTMEDGGLGLANIVDYKLYLWSRDVRPDKDAKWTHIEAFDLKKLLPSCPDSDSLDVIGYGPGIIFLWVDDMIFTIEVKTSRVTEVCKANDNSRILPFMSFYMPALGAYADEEPRVVS